MGHHGSDLDGEVKEGFLKETMLVLSAEGRVGDDREGNSITGRETGGAKFLW